MRSTFLLLCLLGLGVCLPAHWQEWWAEHGHRHGNGKAEPFPMGPDCLGQEPFPCEAPWAYCLDAPCGPAYASARIAIATPTKTPPTPRALTCVPTLCAHSYLGDNGVYVSDCKCTLNPKGWSIGPAKSDGGAPCIDHGPTGRGMCEAMKNGHLISTYAPRGDLMGGPVGMAICAPKTPWVYCFGAPCEKAITDDGIEYGNCHCPFVYSNSSLPQPIAVPQTVCKTIPPFTQLARICYPDSLIHHVRVGVSHPLATP